MSLNANPIATQLDAIGTEIKCGNTDASQIYKFWILCTYNLSLTTPSVVVVLIEHVPQQW